MKKILFVICAILIASCGILLCADENKQVQPAGATSSTDTDAKIEKIDAIVDQTKDIIKKKEEHVEVAKEETAKVLEEKKEIEQEAKIKGEAATVAKQEAEAAKKEAQMSRNREAARKAKELEKQARDLEKEATLYNQKASVAESKAQVALENIASKQAKLQSLKEALEGLKREKTEKLPIVDKLVNAAVIILISLLIFMIMRLILKGVEKAIGKKRHLLEREVALRSQTLIKLFSWMAAILISAVAVYMVLESFGISVAPLLAGAGIVGLAFGFGGQYLIRDVISGFFILMEGQYNINDVIKIGEYSGLVEDVNLRITVLRDLEGRVIFIPNGEIKTVINFTKEYAQALFDIRIAYKEDIDKVIEVIKEMGREMRKDSFFGGLILDDLEMFGVDDLTDTAVVIKFRMKTLPIRQWDVAREFRKRLKARFDKLGIEIPFPQMKLHWDDGKSASGPSRKA